MGADSDYDEITILIDGWLWNLADASEPERKTASPPKEPLFRRFVVIPPAPTTPAASGASPGRC